MSTFALDIRKWVEKTKHDADAVVRAAALRISNELVMRSPVGDPSKWATPLTKSRKTGKMHFNKPKGYVGGLFRNNWMLGVDAPVSGTIPAIDPTGMAARARMMAAIPPNAAGHVYFITNNMPYARRLEDGHSGQAPYGMVALTVVSWNNIVNDAVNDVKSGGGDMSAGFAAYSL